MLLTRMKTTAEVYLHSVITDAVITVPACFNDDGRRRESIGRWVDKSKSVKQRFQKLDTIARSLRAHAVQFGCTLNLT